MKRLAAFWIAAALILSLTPGCGKPVPLTVLDGEGNVLAVLSGKEDAALSAHPDAAYLQIALSEALSVLTEAYDGNEKKAEKRLFEGALTLETAFSRSVSDALGAALSGEEGLSRGAAATDLAGRLIAAVSFGSETVNFASRPTAPYSAVKPLAVYGPAMEKGLIHWSSLYADAPVKQVDDGRGGARDWPQNADGVYAGEKVTVVRAVKRSLNTVAVRVAAELGVPEILSFMRTGLGAPQTYEEQKAALEGAEEVLGNVALGYLYEGFSPVEMAGYYQCFANGGVYIAPGAATRLLAADGTEIFRRDPAEKRLFSPATACVMNHLLQEVVSPGGTGYKAALPGQKVAGKTGTGDAGAWFVGVTPQYTCAVWHGTESPENKAPALFAAAVGAFPTGEKTEYPPCETVFQAAYCPETGLRYTAACRRMELGWYAADPGVCTAHR